MSKAITTVKTLASVGLFALAALIAFDALVSWSPRYGVPMLVILVGVPFMLMYFKQPWRLAIVIGGFASVIVGLILLSLTFSVY